VIVTLSFCIPTYNRAAFIAKAVESIAGEAKGASDEIEIVIVDGASTDQTEQVVRELQTSFPNIRYWRRETNAGVDADILKAVELARGEYCWLMSDDDCIEVGGVQHVLDQLKRNAGIAGASVNAVAYDRTMTFRVRTVPAASGGCLTSDVLFNDREKCFAILGIHFGYLSAQVVNRSLWQAVVSEENLGPYHNSWLLVYIVGSMLMRNPKWLYIHQPSVRYRSGNDSFSARLGMYNRQLITHVAFEKVVSALFGTRSRVYRAVFGTLVSDRMARSLAVMKADGLTIALQLRLFLLYTKRYWYFPRYWLMVVPVFLIPNTVLKIIRFAYFRAKSSASA
jgi:abequosyltransferase